MNAGIRKTPSLYSFSVLLAIFMILLAIFPGIYFEEFTDIIFSGIFTGFLQNEPGSIFNNYECLFGFAKGIQAVQSYIPDTNFYGIFIVLINSFCVFNFIQIAYKHLIENKTIHLVNLIFFLILSSLFFYEYIFVQFTKTAIYCVFLGFYLLIYYKESMLKAILLIITGLLLRAEAFWLVLVLFTGISLIIDKFKFISAVKNKKTPLLSLLIIGVLISITNKKPFNEDDKRYEQFRPYKYSILDFKLKEADDLHSSQKNRIKKEALQSAFFGDTDSLLNENVFKTLEIPKHERFDFLALNTDFSVKNILRKIKSNFNFIRQNNMDINLLVLSICIAIVILLIKLRKYRDVKKTGSAFGFLIVLILSITIYIKMETRVLNPVLFIGVFYISIHYFKKGNFVSYGYLTGTVIALLLILVQINFVFKSSFKLKYRIELNKNATQFIIDWKKNNVDKILVPELFAWEIFHTKAINFNNPAKNIQCFSLDDGYLSMMKNHLNFTKEKVHSNHYKAYINYLMIQKDKVYFLGSDERMLLLQKYINEIYSLEIKFKKINTFPEIKGYGATGYKEYYLYKVF